MPPDPRFYTLVGKTPVRCLDPPAWAEWYEHADRVVQQTTLPHCWVSTIFLGFDWGRDRLLFETMVFWDETGPWEQVRCSTWHEARLQHAMVVENMRRPRAIRDYAARYFQEFFECAIADLLRIFRGQDGSTLFRL